MKTGRSVTLYSGANTRGKSTSWMSQGFTGLDICHGPVQNVSHSDMHRETSERSEEEELKHEKWNVAEPFVSLHCLTIAWFAYNLNISDYFILFVVPVSKAAEIKPQQLRLRFRIRSEISTFLLQTEVTVRLAARVKRDINSFNDSFILCSYFSISILQPAISHVHRSGHKAQSKQWRLQIFDYMHLENAFGVEYFDPTRWHLNVLLVQVS